MRKCSRIYMNMSMHCLCLHAKCKGDRVGSRAGGIGERVSCVRDAPLYSRYSFARRGQLSLTGEAGGRSRTKVNLQRAPLARSRPQVALHRPPSVAAAAAAVDSAATPIRH